MPTKRVRANISDFGRKFSKPEPIEHPERLYALRRQCVRRVTWVPRWLR